MVDDTLHLVGYASGIAGVDIDCGNGPIVIQQSSFMKELVIKGCLLDWVAMLTPKRVGDNQALVHDITVKLALKVSYLLRNNKRFCVVGGDHTSALGTWSGTYDALHQKGEIGLIWIDAHMDSHTPETSETKRIHGMPLASLMGYGPPDLTTILHASPKIKPENTCLIGVRSYEAGEAALLKRLNVKVYFMEEVRTRGFAAVLEEAIAQVSAKTIAYGISLDLDSIDPIEAPAVDVPEQGGIYGKEIEAGLLTAIKDPKFIGSEIVEFDPKHDIDQKTEKLICSFLEILGKKHQDESSADEN